MENTLTVTIVMTKRLGHLGKDANHGIVALLIVEHCKGEHLKTVGCELAVEKSVDQVDLDTAVGQVHYLAEHKPGGGLACDGNR